MLLFIHFFGSLLFYLWLVYASFLIVFIALWSLPAAGERTAALFLSLSLFLTGCLFFWVYPLLLVWQLTKHVSTCKRCLRHAHKSPLTQDLKKMIIYFIFHTFCQFIFDYSVILWLAITYDRAAVFWSPLERQKFPFSRETLQFGNFSSMNWMFFPKTLVAF